VSKLEEEAAGIALATEEEYMQYQQLKQVPPCFFFLSLWFACALFFLSLLPLA